jgi:DNA-binding CsgD family transcriptional regulator
MALTEQEKKILALEAKGFYNYQIARFLHGNSRTVFRQRKRTCFRRIIKNYVRILRDNCS